MSGGSHGYIGRRMRYGDLIEQEQDLLGLIDALKRYLDAPVDRMHNEAWGENEVSYYRPASDAERADIAMYGKELLEEFHGLALAVHALKDKAAALADIGDVIDRADSGDDGIEAVHETILLWGRRRTRTLY